MSVRRALVGCAVLSLQDAAVVYPCCKGCFSRIDVEQEDTTRCRCSRCGYRCVREQVDYRYRLSLRVARDRCIFGVTVFGNSLNPFFGIPASGLQRLVGNADGPVGPSTRLKMLAKAVEDCFIGRHFVFGIKLVGTESGPWSGGPVARGSGSKNTAQYVASQMILPKATGLRGCTVVSYYKILLQKAAEYEVGSADTSKTSRLPVTPLLLTPGHSPTSSFSDTTLSASGLLSLRRSQHPDGTLTQTPSWQQSLGVITSSAEQDEGCSVQDSGGENRTPPHPARTRSPENRKVTEERTPLLSLEQSFVRSPSFAKYPNSVGNSPILNTWFSPSQPGHRRYSPEVKELSTRQLNTTSSLACEDLPFSESLSEFLCEENKDVKQDVNGHCQKETTRNDLKLPNLRKVQPRRSYSQILVNIPAPHGGDSRVCKNPVEHANRSPARTTSSHECNREDEEASSPSFEKEEEQLEGDTYNCSADLFSSSLMISMNTEKLSTHGEVCPLFSKPDLQHQNENADVTHSTPDQLKCKKSNNRNSFLPNGTQECDFVPPSQSTPIVKLGVASQSPASLYRHLTGEFSLNPDTHDAAALHGNVCELVSKNPATTTSVPCKLNTISAKQLFKCSRKSTKENLVWSTTSSRRRLTSGRSCCKLDGHQNHLQAQQHPRVQRGVVDLSSAVPISHKWDSRVCDASVCDYEDSEVIVPPTPAGPTHPSRMLRRRRQTDNGSSKLESTWAAQQGGGVNGKRSLLAQTVSSSHRGVAQTGNGDGEKADEESLGGSNDHLSDDGNHTCDCSRDLFSDSG
ncbi:uncharacterized protein ddias [Brachyistius frenatus]|uniref:uncharacterized protein ddias n=1 Tax=Brachyistius frenatus TaxID=100188 RepID=UPI0037E97F0A